MLRVGVSRDGWGDGARGGGWRMMRIDEVYIGNADGIFDGIRWADPWCLWNKEFARAGLGLEGRWATRLLRPGEGR